MDRVKKRRRAVIFVMCEMVVCLLLSITCYGVKLLSSYEYEELDPSIYRETTTRRAPAATTTAAPSSETTGDTDPADLEEQTEESRQTVSVQEVTLPDEPSRSGYRNILVVGLDKGENGNRYGFDDPGRNADVMIIVSINNDTGEVRLASVMRDLILRMEEGSNMPYNKANAQYAQSGLSDTVSMINRNFGLDIGEYVTINWYSVATVIDQMGGVDLNIPNEQFLRYFNGYLTEVNEVTGIWAPQLTSPGTYHMTGTQAVAYCRIRYVGVNDDGRTENQRIVIQQLFEKAKQLAKAGDIATLLTVGKTALSNVKTNLNPADIIRMIAEVGNYSIGGSEKLPVNGVSGKYLGSYYSRYQILDPVVAVNFEQEVRDLHTFLFNDPTYETSDFVKNISYQMTLDRTGK
ncbi:MAG: LCP family protein [Lachnospiraceae bacterium]|nr:LCP family protein [Lachnospiraceae bacterium]